MNKVVIIGIVISAIASVMIVNFPALIAQYGGTGSEQKATQEQLEECKKLGIPEFSCTEQTILAKKRLIEAGQKGAYGAGTAMMIGKCDSSDLECRIAKLENDVKLLKEKLGIEDPRLSISVTNHKIVVGDSGASGSFLVKNSGNVPISVDSITVRGKSIPFQSFTLQPDESKMVEYVIPAGVVSKADIGATTTVSVFAGSAGSIQTVSIQPES